MTDNDSIPMWPNEDGTWVNRRPLTTLQRKQLLSDLNPLRVSERAAPGGSRKMSYLEAWDVRAMMIRVFGFGGWSGDVVDAKIVKVETDIPKRNGNGTTAFRVTTMVTYRLRIHQLGASYTEVAIASQAGSDIGEVADFAVKTAESDAFKRAAMNLGTQFGLSLYNQGQTADVVKQVQAPTQNSRSMRRIALVEQRDLTQLLAAEGASGDGEAVEPLAPSDRVVGTDRDFAPDVEPEAQNPKPGGRPPAARAQKPPQGSADPVSDNETPAVFDSTLSPTDAAMDDVAGAFGGDVQR